MKLSNYQQVFLEFLKAGLWEIDVRLSEYGDFDWGEVYKLTQEQSMSGLVLAGLEHSDVKPPQELLLQWIGDVQMIEQRNKAMNEFVASLAGQLEKDGIRFVLVKGQGVAQCYERPLWRTSGDVDLLMDESNYEKAVKVLTPLASHVEDEQVDISHSGMTIDSWVVELHGSLRSKLSKKIDNVIDDVQDAVLHDECVRLWMNGNTQVLLSRADEDVIFVFSHILQHFFNGGIGLRQVCDWCRLLWTYREKLKLNFLEQRLREMGLFTEWKTFAYLSVNTLGMPTEAMPFYSSSNKWKKKAYKVLALIMAAGNMGHNRDYSYREQYSRPMRKLITLYRVTIDSYRHFCIFPKDTIVAWSRIIRKGIIDTHNGM